MGAKMKKIIFLSVLMASSSSVLAETRLFVKPKKCVSLHKGQTCYQTLKFTWQSDSQFCLFVDNSAQAIHCAEAGKGQLIYHFESERGRQFQLRNNDGAAVASVDVEVASVYKGQRRATTGWRIF